MPESKTIKKSHLPCFCSLLCFHFSRQRNPLFPCSPMTVFFTKSFQMFFFFFASSLYEGRGRKTLSPNQKPTEAAFWPWLIFTSVTSYNFKTISLYALFPPPNVSFHSIMNLNAAESCGSDLACKNVSQSKQDVLSGLECSNHLWITGLVFAKWKAIWLAKKKKICGDTYGF